MRHSFSILFSGLLLALFSVLGCSSDTKPDTLSGTYRGVLSTDGGPLAFNFVIGDNERTGYVINSTDTLAFSAVSSDTDLVVLHFDFYDARLAAERVTGDSLSGYWIRQAPGSEQNRLPFEAVKGVQYRYPATNPTIDLFEGSWAVTFTDSSGKSNPATGIFATDDRGTINGTFARETGDYRYLEGVYTDSSFILSSFDGARSYLIKGRALSDSTLQGKIWIRDNEYFTWTATRGQQDLMDPLQTAAAFAVGNQMEFSFPNASGKVINSWDSQYTGNPMVVYLFGSWCPNCADQAALLKEYSRNEFSDSDLQIVGLAYEYTGMFERDALMVDRYQQRHNIPWALLVAGDSDKEDAAETLSFTNIILSYPTTYFVNRNHEIEAVHVGFNGPATGPYYLMERERFKEQIQNIVN